ncbi:MAG: glycosyltransferase family 2 protein [Minwuia sp.]|uniref:glycosyltransferase family 2 protein n=1 Tax=Minwuia sp. TaxID=2493630 RepID=UPI003A86D020
MTIGMPTYQRAHTIRRALASIARQNYRQFVLIVSDNAGEDPETIGAVRDIASDLPEVILVAQEKNLGALSNLNFLLAVAETEYFMWLADDDEITQEYLSELVRLLDSDPASVTAMGQWLHMSSPSNWKIMPQLRPESHNRMHRLAHFVAGRADDSAFYGLHRTDCLRRCQFGGYFPPNRGVLTNWCFVFLYDLLLQGHILYTKNATWICHNHGEKSYERALARGVGDRLKTLIRRINVYAIFIGKTAQKAPLLTPIILGASLIGLTRDIAAAGWRLSGYVLKRHAKVHPGAEG